MLVMPMCFEYLLSTKSTAKSFCIGLYLMHPWFSDNSTQSFHFFFFFLFRAIPEAYGSSQARGQIGAVAAGLHHSHSNSGSQLCLQPTPQLTATVDT